jgi:hypothetical protein
MLLKKVTPILSEQQLQQGKDATFHGCPFAFVTSQDKGLKLGPKEVSPKNLEVCWCTKHIESNVTRGLLGKQAVSPRNLEVSWCTKHKESNVTPWFAWATV